MALRRGPPFAEQSALWHAPSAAIPLLGELHSPSERRVDAVISEDNQPDANTSHGEQAELRDSSSKSFGKQRSLLEDAEASTKNTPSHNTHPSSYSFPEKVYPPPMPSNPPFPRLSSHLFSSSTTPEGEAMPGGGKALEPPPRRKGIAISSLPDGEYFIRFDPSGYAVSVVQQGGFWNQQRQREVGGFLRSKQQVEGGRNVSHESLENGGGGGLSVGGQRGKSSTTPLGGARLPRSPPSQYREDIDDHMLFIDLSKKPAHTHPSAGKNGTVVYHTSVDSPSYLFLKDKSTREMMPLEGIATGGRGHSAKNQAYQAAPAKSSTMMATRPLQPPKIPQAFPDEMQREKSSQAGVSMIHRVVFGEGKQVKSSTTEKTTGYPSRYFTNEERGGLYVHTSPLNPPRYEDELADSGSARSLKGTSTSAIDLEDDSDKHKDMQAEEATEREGYLYEGFASVAVSRGLLQKCRLPLPQKGFEVPSSFPHLHKENARFEAARIISQLGEMYKNFLIKGLEESVDDTNGRFNEKRKNMFVSILMAVFKRLTPLFYKKIFDRQNSSELLVENRTDESNEKGATQSECQAKEEVDIQKLVYEAVYLNLTQHIKRTSQLMKEWNAARDLLQRLSVDPNNISASIVKRLAVLKQDVASRGEEYYTVEETKEVEEGLIALHKGETPAADAATHLEKAAKGLKITRKFAEVFEKQRDAIGIQSRKRMRKLQNNVLSGIHDCLVTIDALAWQKDKIGEFSRLLADRMIQQIDEKKHLKMMQDNAKVCDQSGVEEQAPSEDTPPHLKSIGFFPPLEGDKEAYRQFLLSDDSDISLSETPLKIKGGISKRTDGISPENASLEAENRPINTQDSSSPPPFEASTLHTASKIFDFHGKSSPASGFSLLKKFSPYSNDESVASWSHIATQADNEAEEHMKDPLYLDSSLDDFRVPLPTLKRYF